MDDIKIGDIIYFGKNKNSEGIVLEIIKGSNGIIRLKINRGFKISISAIKTLSGKRLIYKSDKKTITQEELLLTKTSQHYKKCAKKKSDIKPLYKKSFRTWLYTNKNKCVFN